MFCDAHRTQQHAKQLYHIQSTVADNRSTAGSRYNHRVANKWQMSFNVDKCSVMHIGHNNMQSNYIMSNQLLPTTDQQRDLGIIIVWQKQTEKSCKTANRVLEFIVRNFRYKNKELILPLYKSLFRPHLEHAVQFWSPHLRRDIDKMEKIQRRATKMIREIWNHSYHQQIQDLDLISLVQRRLRG